MDGDRTVNQHASTDALASTRGADPDAAGDAGPHPEAAPDDRAPMGTGAVTGGRWARLRTWWRSSVPPYPAGQRRSAPSPGGTPSPEQPPGYSDAQFRRLYVVVPIICSAVVGLVPVLAGFLAVAFELFPGLQPAEPPDVRGVTLTQVELVERDRPVGPGMYRDIVRFEVEAIGYDSDTIAIEWLILDAATLMRLEEMPVADTSWPPILFSTRTDRVSGEIEIEPLRDHDQGCVIVRVYVRLHDAPEGEQLFLDMADTAPYDPGDPPREDCAALAT